MVNLVGNLPAPKEPPGFVVDIQKHEANNLFWLMMGSFFENGLLFGLSPWPATVTTRIILFLVGDPYKPSFATVTGRGDNPT